MTNRINILILVCKIGYTEKTNTYHSNVDVINFTLVVPNCLNPFFHLAHIVMAEIKKKNIRKRIKL